MRLSIRVKQIAGVTAIVGVAAVVLSAVYVTRLSAVVLHESHQRGQLLARTIWHRAREVALVNPDPYSAFRTDPGLRAILESSLYGESVTDAAILDPQGVVVADSDDTQVGKRLAERPDLGAVADAGPIDKLRIIYSEDGRTLEVREPMPLGAQSLGSIRIGVSTLLMRRSLTDALKPALYTAAAALAISVFVAALLSQLLLRPIHVIRSGLTRLGKGEFGVTLDLPPGDEFGELGTFFNTVSQQLSADRSLLAGQKANLQVAVEHLEDAVALFNPSGELLFTNPAMQRTLPAHAVGRAMQGLLPTGHPYRTIVEETLATRRSRGPMQVRVNEQQSEHATGRNPEAVSGSDAAVRSAEQNAADADVLLLTHAIAATDGELVGVLLVSRDLAYLSRMQSTLAYSRKLVALGRLTAGIAHEVKNPLNAMMIHLELLRTKIRNGLVAPARDPEPVAASATSLGLAASSGRTATLTPGVQGALQHVEIIESEIRRLDEVVQGFLKFSRPEDLRLQPVRVAAMFDEILPVINPEAEKNNVRVNIDCPANATVNADGGMLRQAFLNLAINACQAMPTGGSLRLACGMASRERIEVRFEDTGVGIPPQNLEKIFDLYFTTKDHGTGIGLSMVYRIIQLHDGEIEVQSTPGRGTTFRVLLPKANEI